MKSLGKKNKIEKQRTKSQTNILWKALFGWYKNLFWTHIGNNVFRRFTQSKKISLCSYTVFHRPLKPEDQWSCKRSPESAAYTNKHVWILWYLTPVQGQMKPLGCFLFQNNQYSVHLPISYWLFPSNDTLTVFPIQMHGQPMLTLP